MLDIGRIYTSLSYVPFILSLQIPPRIYLSSNDILRHIVEEEIKKARKGDTS